MDTYNNFKLTFWIQFYNNEASGKPKTNFENPRTFP